MQKWTFTVKYFPSAYSFHRSRAIWIVELRNFRCNSGLIRIPNIICALIDMYSGKNATIRYLTIEGRLDTQSIDIEY